MITEKEKYDLSLVIKDLLKTTLKDPRLLYEHAILINGACIDGRGLDLTDNLLDCMDINTKEVSLYLDEMISFIEKYPQR